MIIFINGTINSGKSTVARLVAKEINNCAILESDTLRHFLPWMTVDEAIPLTIKNTISVLKNLTEEGINTIVPYPIRKEDYEQLIAELESIDTMHFFTLQRDIEISMTNTNERVLTEWERDRINYHFESGLVNPDFGIVVHSTNQTPEETTQQILNHIASSEA